MDTSVSGYILAQTDERYFELILNLDPQEIIEIDNKLRKLDQHTFGALLDEEQTKLIDSF